MKKYGLNLSFAFNVFVYDNTGQTKFGLFYDFCLRFKIMFKIRDNCDLDNRPNTFQALQTTSDY